MNSEYKKKILNAVIGIGDEQLSDVLQEYSNKLSKEISDVISPISVVTAPVQIQLLEDYAKCLRRQFPEASGFADELIKNSEATAVTMPMIRRVKLD